MKSQSPQYDIYDSPDALPVELAGRIGGEEMGSIDYAWRASLRATGRRSCISAFIDADERRCTSPRRKTKEQ